MLRLMLQFFFVIASSSSHFIFFSSVAQKVFVSQSHSWENLNQQKHNKTSTTDVSMSTIYN